VTPDAGNQAADVRRAIAAADVGADTLTTDLAAVDGLAVDVRGGTAHLSVTVPVPDGAGRDRLERELRSALTDVAAVDRVTVGWEPDPADTGERVDQLPGVNHVVAVASGKGGVGKSTVASNLAVGLADAGAAVGLLDADVYGPNAPTLLGLDDTTPATTVDAQIVPREGHGVRAVSMDFIVDEDDPIIWRGPMVDDVLKQLTEDVQWGELDYLVVDMPPGTGDAQLTLVQYLPVSGAVVVTTPDPVAVADARRGLEGFARYDVPILGVVENMAGFECPDCGSTHDLFDDGGGAELAAEFDVPVLGEIPVDPAIAGTDDAERSEPPGVSLPVVGRVGLPRTAGERARSTTREPAVVGDDATGQAFAATVARTAARVDAAATGRANGE
jgi:ATP-binding protein involved in chromosome partitioning